MRSGRNTGIILSQKLIELPVLNEKNQVDCIYVEQDANISSEIKALEKAIKKTQKIHSLKIDIYVAFRRRTDLPAKITRYLEGRNARSMAITGIFCKMQLLLWAAWLVHYCFSSRQLSMSVSGYIYVNSSLYMTTCQLTLILSIAKEEEVSIF